MQTIKDALNPALADYHKSPEPGEVDLLAEVRTLLTQAGLGPKLVNGFENNAFIQEAANKPANIQRFLLNRYWTQQLMYSVRTSIEERYCLIPNGSIADWLSLFKEKVLPFVVANDLPITTA